MRDDLERDRSDSAHRQDDAITRAAADERWKSDDRYWRASFADRPPHYAAADLDYDAYRPAYRYGCEASFVYHPLPWNDDVDLELSLGWQLARGNSKLSWELVRDAVRQGFEKARG